MVKKTNFQKEIEDDERRLKEIYNRVLRMYHLEEEITRPEGNCVIA